MNKIISLIIILAAIFSINCGEPWTQEWHALKFPVTITAENIDKDYAIKAMHWWHSRLGDHWLTYCANYAKADCLDMPRFLEYQDAEATVTIKEVESLSGNIAGLASPVTSPLGTIGSCLIEIEKDLMRVDIISHELGHCAFGLKDLYDIEDENNIVYFSNNSNYKQLDYWQAEKLFDYYFLLKTMPPIAFR